MRPSDNFALSDRLFLIDRDGFSGVPDILGLLFPRGKPKVVNGLRTSTFWIVRPSETKITDEYVLGLLRKKYGHQAVMDSWELNSTILRVDKQCSQFIIRISWNYDFKT